VSERAFSFLLAAVGALAVAAIALLGYDIWRSARTGPRWKRRLVGAGLALLVSLGVVSCEPQVMCYKPAPVPISQKSAKRLREQLVLLDKLLAEEKVDPAVARKVIEAIEKELGSGVRGGEPPMDPDEEQTLRKEAWQKVRELRQRLDSSTSGSTDARTGGALADSGTWKRVAATWRESEEIASGKRGAYPFNERGKKRALAAIDQAVTDVGALQQAGHLAEAEAGLLTLDLAQLKRGVEAKRPTEMRMATCYDPMAMTPARDSMKRLAARLPLLEKLAAAETLQPGVVRKVLASIEADHATLSKPAMIERLPEADRQRAVALRDDVGGKVTELKARLSQPAQDPQQ